MKKASITILIVIFIFFNNVFAIDEEVEQILANINSNSIIIDSIKFGDSVKDIKNLKKPNDYFIGIDRMIFEGDYDKTYEIFFYTDSTKYFLYDVKSSKWDKIFVRTLPIGKNLNDNKGDMIWIVVAARSLSKNDCSKEINAFENTIYIKMGIPYSEEKSKDKMERVYTYLSQDKRFMDRMLVVDCSKKEGFFIVKDISLSVYNIASRFKTIEKITNFKKITK